MIEGIITRPIIGVNWTFDTAVVFKRNPKSRIVPVIAKHLKRTFLLPNFRHITELGTCNREGMPNRHYG